MAVAIETSFDQQCDSNGVPLSGGTITVYDAGTTTSRSLYSDTALSVAATNPITLDSSGRHDMRYISATAYKYVVKSSSGSMVYTRDNVDPGVPIGSGTLAIANGGTGASDASTALTNLGGATQAQLTTLSAEVASLAGAVGSTGVTRIAAGTTAQRPTEDLTEGMMRRNLTTDRFEYYDGSSWVNFVTTDSIPDGHVVQVVNTTTTAVSNTSTTMDLDDSIPQNTEGAELFTRSITPSSSTNKLRIDVVINASPNGAIHMCAGLFQDSTANALAAAAKWMPASGGVEQICFTHYMTAGTTSATTFKVRAGPSSSAQITFNGASTARYFGGVYSSSITVTEIKAS